MRTVASSRASCAVCTGTMPTSASSRASRRRSGARAGQWPCLAGVREREGAGGARGHAGSQRARGNGVVSAGDARVALAGTWHGQGGRFPWRLVVGLAWLDEGEYRAPLGHADVSQGREGVDGV
jgi:hypothetical protein